MLKFKSLLIWNIKNTRTLYNGSKHHFKPSAIIDEGRKERDETKYRINLFEHDEHRLFWATLSDQWGDGIRPKGVDYRLYAEDKKIYPRFRSMSIPGLNSTGDPVSLSPGNTVSVAHNYNSLYNHQVSDRARSFSKNFFFAERDWRSSAARGSPMQDVISGEGITSKRIIGKSFGPPRRYESDNSTFSYDARFQSRILMSDYRKMTWAQGAFKCSRVVVAVGNEDGLVGVGMTVAPRLVDGLLEAKQAAYHQLVHVSRTETNSIPYSVRGRYHQTELHAIPDHTGVIKAQRIVRMLLELGGYRGVAVKLFGRNSTESIVKAFFNTFTHFESYEDQANALNRYVVRFDPKKYYAPEVLAKPKDPSNPRPFTGEIEGRYQ